MSTVGAVATGICFGARYRLDPDWTMAAAVSDLDTKLDVEVIVSDNTGTTVNNYTVSFLRKIAVGAVYRLTNCVLAVDYEIKKGKYGSTVLNIQAARLGFEKVVQAWSYRAGALVPFIFSSSAINGNLLNLSVMPVIGLGWREGGIQVDLVLYAHPVMSISQGRPASAFDLMLTWRY